MGFNGACIILLVAILVTAILILLILVRNLLREFKRKFLRKLRSELRDQVGQGVEPVLEQLHDMKHNGLMPLGEKIFDIQSDIRSVLWNAVGDCSSYMLGAQSESKSGEAYHVYRNGRWDLQEDFSNAGYEASRPTMDGSYDGQVIKTTSTPSSGPNRKCHP